MVAELAPETVRGIVQHMNDDHADALLACVHAFSAHPDADAARMTDIDAYGFRVDVVEDGTTTSLVLPFDEPLADVAEVRPVLVAMTRSARARLEGRGAG